MGLQGRDKTKYKNLYAWKGPNVHSMVVKRPGTIKMLAEAKCPAGGQLVENRWSSERIQLL